MMTMMALVKSTNPFMKRDNRVVAQIISDMQQQLLLLFICGNLATFQLLHTRGTIDYRRELSVGNNFPPQPWAARLLRTPKGGISHGSAKILISLEQALRASKEVLEPSQYAFPWKFLSQTGTHTGWKQEFCSITGELHYLQFATNILVQLFTLWEKRYRWICGAAGSQEFSMGSVPSYATALETNMRKILNNWVNLSFASCERKPIMVRIVGSKTTCDTRANLVSLTKPKGKLEMWCAGNDQICVSIMRSE